MNRLLLMPATHDIFTHPLRWAGKHLAFYAAASLIAGSAFVVAAGVYSHFAPMPAKIDPNISSPDVPQTVPSEPLEFYPPAKPGDQVLVSGLGKIQAGSAKAITVRLGQTKETVAKIRMILNEKNGGSLAIVELPSSWGSNPAPLILPTSKFMWSTDNDGSFVAGLAPDDWSTMMRDTPRTNANERNPKPPGPPASANGG